MAELEVVSNECYNLMAQVYEAHNFVLLGCTLTSPTSIPARYLLLLEGAPSKLHEKSSEKLVLIYHEKFQLVTTKPFKKM